MSDSIKVQIHSLFCNCFLNWYELTNEMLVEYCSSDRVSHLNISVSQVSRRRRREMTYSRALIETSFSSLSETVVFWRLATRFKVNATTMTISQRSLSRSNSSRRLEISSIVSDRWIDFTNDSLSTNSGETTIDEHAKEALSDQRRFLNYEHEILTWISCSSDEIVVLFDIVEWDRDCRTNSWFVWTVIILNDVRYDHVIWNMMLSLKSRVMNFLASRLNSSNEKYEADDEIVSRRWFTSILKCRNANWSNDSAKRLTHRSWMKSFRIMSSFIDR